MTFDAHVEPIVTSQTTSSEGEANLAAPLEEALADPNVIMAAAHAGEDRDRNRSRSPRRAGEDDDVHFGGVEVLRAVRVG